MTRSVFRARSRRPASVRVAQDDRASRVPDQLALRMASSGSGFGIRDRPGMSSFPAGSYRCRFDACSSTPSPPRPPCLRPGLRRHECPRRARPNGWGGGPDG
ncbi:hypothetical protein [Streptomyces sp. WAC05374]|uniref:hypothetical protein n=1 Tax=Streptomyces sp. WAC05374 TaxID=2487420 RepID=UPI00135BB8D8|nr:hypothetical protein [Streptomyces sp. WAC05374]